MPLSLPNLDDRRYADLVEEARALIPSYAPEWTNHNPSDPGITLVELFAYLTEMLVYRVNRVTDENMRAFVKLIAGERANPARPLGDEIRDAVQGLRRTVRAVTAEDYERLATTRDGVARADVARALCLPLRDLGGANPFAQESKGDVSVVVLPAKAPPGSAEAEAILEEVRQDLEPRKLLTTRLHVVEPRYVTLKLTTTLVLKPGAKERTEEDETGEGEPRPSGDSQQGVVDSAVGALRDFFDPLRGGPERRGWPFGRSIYVSEIYALLDRLPGVEYVSALQLKVSFAPRAGATAGGDARDEREKTEGGKTYAFELEPDELVDTQISTDDITAERATLAPKFDLK